MKETYDKTGLEVGQRFQLRANAPTLFLNDNLIAGCAIEEELNIDTTHKGAIVSGDLDTEPITISSLWESNPHAVEVTAVRLTGFRGVIENVSIELRLFLQHFKKTSS